MKKKLFVGLIVIVVLAVGVFSGCQENESDPVDHEPTDEEIVYNPEDSLPLRLAVTQPTALNPLFNGNESLFQLNHLIYESLITFDEHMNVEPLLAESWEMDEDSRSVTFRLRDNVQWHDGEPFVPEDVVFTFQVLREMGEHVAYPNVYAGNLNQVADVRKIDEHQVRFSFTRPYSNALETMVFPILPHHRFTGTERRLLQSDDFPMVGTGRYRVDEYEVSRSIRLHYFPGYWGQKPYIDRIDVQIVPDRQALISLFENGKIDMVEPVTVDWEKYTDNESVEGVSYPSTHFELIGFNFENPWLQERSLRQAVAHSINRETLLEQVYFGHGTLTDVPFPPHSWLYPQEELRYVHDIDRAQGLLAELDLPEDFSLRLLTNSGNPLREKAAEQIAEFMETIGIAVELEILEWNDVQERLSERDFDLVLTGWQMSMLPDLSFAFHSTQLDDGNFIGYVSEPMDVLLENAFTASNKDEKNQRWNDILDYVREEIPYATLFFKEHALLYRTTMRGDLSPTHFNIFRGIETAYLIGPRENGD